MEDIATQRGKLLAEFVYHVKRGNLIPYKADAAFLNDLVAEAEKHFVRPVNPFAPMPNPQSGAARPPTHPYHIELEAVGHKLIRDANGEVDDFRLDVDDLEGVGGHNGPECSICGKTWCVACREKVEPCTPPGHSPECSAARLIAKMVSESAETCHYVRAYDNPKSDPNAARAEYEKWLQSRISQILKAPPVHPRILYK